MEFKDRLKQYRIDNNLTQEEFAEKLFVSRQAVSKYETGRSYPSFETMTVIAELMGISIDELISKEELAKETIYTVGETRKNKRNLFILLGLIVAVVIISVIAIVLSLRNAQRAPDGLDGADNSGTELVGLVGTTQDQIPTISDLTNDKLFGYSFIYNDDEEMMVGTSYNVSSLHSQFAPSGYTFDMSLILSRATRYVYFYAIYYDVETSDYLFEKYYALDLDIGTEFDTVLERNDFSWRFIFNIKRVDKLLEMNIYEYGTNGEQISGKSYVNETEYTISADCLYVVVEEKLQDSNGKVYYNREVIYNSQIDKIFLYPLKIVDDLGFGESSLIIYKYPM